MSTKYFENQLDGLCSHLQENGCSCVPSVQTELKCESTMDVYVAKEYRAILESKNKFVLRVLL